MNSALSLVILIISVTIYSQQAKSVESGLLIADPPPVEEYALMARYIIHNSDWLSIATISTREDTKGYPFVSLKSLSDGPVNHSTGVPYLYLTDMDVSGADILVNNNVTILVSLAQSNYCTKNDFDPQDPQCAKVIISGTVTKVSNQTEEYTFGQESLFARHPAMETWPTEHAFYVAKVNPIDILVLDYYGGIKNVSVSDYFNANLTNIINLDSYFRAVSVVIVVA